VTSFSEALDAVKAGKGAYREAWKGYGYPGVMRLEAPGSPYPPMLVVRRPGADPVWMFSGAQQDILAGDWEIVD
jgi:hypothetical protein